MGATESMEGQAVEMLAAAACPWRDGGIRACAWRCDGGRTSHFAREDYVEEAWRIVDPILKNPPPVHEYAKNTWGPARVGETVMPAGGWHDPTGEVHKE